MGTQQEVTNRVLAWAQQVHGEDVTVVTFTRQAFECVVGEDQRQGAYLATQHLLKLGHTSLWHLAGSSDWHDAQVRIAGWMQALFDAGLAGADYDFTRGADPHGFGAARLLRHLLA